MFEMPIGWFIAMVILSAIGAFVLFILFLVFAALLLSKIVDWIEYKIEKRNKVKDSRDQ